MAEWDKKEPTQRTMELRKPRQVPLWVGQKFDKWKNEIVTWNRNPNQSDEEKYLDVIESLKKIHI